MHTHVHILPIYVHTNMFAVAKFWPEQSMDTNQVGHI